LPISLHPLQHADIPTCARIAADAFADDKHTVFKQMGTEPFDMETVTREGLEANLGKRSCVYIKAVSEESGETVGFAGWAFRGVAEAAIPRQKDTSTDSSNGEGKEQEIRKRLENTYAPDYGASGTGPAHLAALEDLSMHHFMRAHMPPGTSCMYILQLIVAPAHQSHGVGRALVRRGNAMADRLGVFMWVHASERAAGLLGMCGFEEVARMDLDLDGFASGPPGEVVRERLGMGVGEGWGRYVVRYMKRLLKGNAGEEVKDLPRGGGQED
ncbi:hypothetical protein K458DRAFT_290931, partial [Lentithecium fluviatile CBS 122367]